MKFGKSFDYDGLNSKDDFGLILVSAGGSESSDTFGLSRDIVKGETTKFRSSANHFSTKYNDVLTFDVTLVKDPCYNASQSEMRLTREEIRKINAWLTSPKLPKLIHFNDYKDTDEHIDYFGVFSDVKPFSQGNELYGVTATITCSSPYGFTEINEYVCTKNSSTVIDNTSDELEDPVYPVITVTPHSTGQITISNDTDGKSVTIDVYKSNILTIDCRNTTIKDKAGVVKLSDLGVTIDNINELYWLRLLSGENTISVSGDADIKISCRYPRKVGVF